MGAESTTRGVCFPCLVEQEVLQESYMMIPDSKGRLQASIQDMKAFLVRFLIGGGHKQYGSSMPNQAMIRVLIIET